MKAIRTTCVLLATGLLLFGPYSAYAQTSQNNSALISVLQQLVVVLEQEIAALIAQQGTATSTPPTTNSTPISNSVVVAPQTGAAAPIAPTCNESVNAQVSTSTQMEAGGVPSGYGKSGIFVTYTDSCGVDKNTSYSITTVQDGGKSYTITAGSIGQWADGTESNLGTNTWTLNIPLYQFSVSYPYTVTVNAGNASTTVVAN